MKSQKFCWTLLAVLFGVVGGLAGVAILDWLLTSRHRRKDVAATLIGIFGGFAAAVLIQELEVLAEKRKRKKPAP